MNKKTEILYLGPEGTYSEIAAKKFFSTLDKSKYNLVKFPSIRKMIEYIDKNPESIAVIPVENSIEGIVRETVDNIIKTQNEDIHAFKEIIIPINNCLVSKNTDITKIKTIYSYTQAIAQCQNWVLNTLGDDIKVITTSSTSEAAKLLCDKDDTHAAIASAETASIYHLNILAENINDENDNKTRFLCFGLERSEITGHDKTAIAFSTLNKAGALVDVLSIFKKYNLNLSYIDSRPSKKFLGNYNFFVDIDGHVYEEKVQKAIQEIIPMTSFYRFIGSFERHSD